MSDQEVLNQLQEASGKLEYLLKLCDNDDTNNHRQAILKKYLKEITDGISEVSNKIIEAYEAINECETSEDSEGDYIELYERLVEEAKRERQFIEDFGMSMTLWHMLL